MEYNYIKALHLIFVITWFAGLFYIVRLFVYHAEAKQKMNTAKSNLDKAKGMTLQEWRLNKSQLQVFSDDEQAGEITEE